MSEESSSLVSQCLAFCQMLATKNQNFNFTLTLGSSFSFSLDTREKDLSPVARKKSSPSTQRRNARRRQQFLDSKNSLEEHEKQTEPQSAVNKSSSLSCDICDFSANSNIGLKLHMQKQHENIEQLDGNTSLNSSANEDLKPEYNTETNETSSELPPPRSAPPPAAAAPDLETSAVVQKIKMCEKHTKIASELKVNQVIPAGWPKSCRDCALLRCN